MAGAGPAIGWAAGAIGTFFTSKAAVYVIARLVAFTAATAILAKRAFAFDPGIASRAITARGTVEPQQKIYGQALVSGPIVFNDVAGVANRDLWVVIPLAGHQVASITDVWLDKDVVANSVINGGAAGGGQVTSGKFAPVDGYHILSLFKHLGTAAQTVDTNLDAAFTAWTSAHRLRGVAYLVAKMTLLVRAEEIWSGSEPTNIRALVNGALVYDPRLDSTQTSLSPAGSGSHRYTDPSTWAWSENPALCTADYLIDTRFGMGLDPTRIDWQSVLDAAEYCEELVDIPGPSTQARYTCNGTLFGTETHRDNLRNLLSSMNGEVTVSAGQWFIRAGQYIAPETGDYFTADDVIEPLGIKANLERSERFNTIKAVFIDSQDYYKPTESPPVYTTALRNRDNGRILETEINLPFVDDFYQAQRICWQQLHIANQEKVVSTTLNHRAGRVAVGERINLEIDELAWSPKVFKLRNWKLVESGDSVGVEVELREDAAAAYADPVIANYAVRSAANVITFADPEAGPPPPWEWFFEDDFSHGDVTRFLSQWTEIITAGDSLSFTTGGPGSAYALVCGDNSGNDQMWRGYDRRSSIPVVASEIYRLSGWISRQAGSGYSYLGINGYSGDVRSGGGENESTSGADTAGNPHAFAANAFDPGDTAWHYVEGYFTAGTGSVAVYNAGTIADPHELHQDVQFMCPWIACNYNGVAGVTLFARIKLERVDSSLVPILGTNVLTSAGVVVGDDAIVSNSVVPYGFAWTTYEAGGWSPADTTQSITVTFWRGSTQIATRLVDATLTASGANEGDIAAAASTSSGDATSVSVTGNNSASVLVTVTHDATGRAAYFTLVSALPGYSGGVSK